jgi:hypothetical protein
MDISRRRRLITALALVAAAAILSTVHWKFGDSKTVPNQDEAWRLSIDIRLHTMEPHGSLLLFPPHDTRTVLLTGQQLSHDDFYIQRQRTSRRGGRQITASAKRAGNLRFVAAYDMHYAPLGHVTSRADPPSMTPDKRELWLSNGAAYQLTSAAVEEVFASINEKTRSQAEFIDGAFRHLQNQVRITKMAGHDEAAVVLRKRQGTALGKAQAMVALLRLAKVPARTVAGFRLQEQLPTKPHYWVEAYIDENWVPYDPTFGHSRQLPGYYLPMNRGGAAIVSFNERPVALVHYELSRGSASLNIASRMNPFLRVLDLASLPLVSRAALGLLMLLPLCVLLTSAITRMADIRGYGVFTPTLLALAVVYSHPLLVIALLGTIVLFSLLGRGLLLGRKAPRGSRLGLTFTLVVLALAFSVSGLNAFWFDISAEVLLPVVVLTSLSDNVYNVLDELGARVAVRRLVITVILALLAYLVMSWEPLGQVLIVHPELHLITLAAFILLSLHKGLKLTRWAPFRWLKEPDKPVSDDGTSVTAH